MYIHSTSLPATEVPLDLKHAVRPDSQSLFYDTCRTRTTHRSWVHTPQLFGRADGYNYIPRLFRARPYATGEPGMCRRRYRWTIWVWICEKWGRRIRYALGRPGDQNVVLPQSKDTCGSFYTYSQFIRIPAAFYPQSSCDTTQFFGPQTMILVSIFIDSCALIYLADVSGSQYMRELCWRPGHFCRYVSEPGSMHRSDPCCKQLSRRFL